MKLETIEAARRIGERAISTMKPWTDNGGADRYHLGVADQILGEVEFFANGLATDPHHREQYIARLVAFLSPE